MTEQEKNSIKIFGTVLVILAVIAAGIWSYNLYRLKHVTYEGLTRYSEAEFLERLDPGFFTSVTPLFCLADTIAPKQIPFVERYEIEFVDRQTANVIVHEKRVTGCVIVMGRYMFFDKDGIVVESADTLVEGVPVITGLKFDEILLFEQLKVQKQSLFDIILQLTRLLELNQISVEKIEFDSNYEVILHREDVTVLLGKRTSYDEVLNALKGILNSISGKKGTLDMRNYSRENGEVILKQQ